MDKGTNKIISDYITLIATQNKQFIKAYLFGSYAKQTDRADSDIDIAFIIKNLNDDEKFDVQVQLMLIASDFDMRIEPHPLSDEDFNSETPFVNEIRQSGIEIEPGTPYSWYS